jgi:NifU-like protein involved in Fe-S cluster formation
MSESALYNRDILRLASSLVPGDRLEAPDGTAEARSPICGSRIQADVALGRDAAITAIALRVNACALGQASAAIVRTHAIGAKPAQIGDLRARLAAALRGEAELPADWPELALLAPARDYPSRHAAILLPYDALLSAADTMKLAS